MVYVRIEHRDDTVPGLVHSVQEISIVAGEGGTEKLGNFVVRLSPESRHRPSFEGWKDPTDPPPAEVRRRTNVFDFDRRRPMLELVRDAIVKVVKLTAPAPARARAS